MDWCNALIIVEEKSLWEAHNLQHRVNSISVLIWEEQCTEYCHL